MSDDGSGGEPTASGSPADSALKVALRAPLAALTLLTIVPVPAAAQRRIGGREVAASAPFFPLVGAVIGLIVGIVEHAAAVHSNYVVGGAIAAVSLAIITGALHLDGLADCADALGARGGAPERRLEIMRDSATGAYGTAALGGWFVLMTAATTSLPIDQLVATFAIAAALGRTAAVIHAAVLKPARAGGLGASFRMELASTGGALVMLALVVLGALLLPSQPPMIVGSFTTGWLHRPSVGRVVAAVITAAVVLAAVTAGARRLIGGRTGDTLGATITLVEVSALLAATLVHR